MSHSRRAEPKQSVWRSTGQREGLGLNRRCRSLSEMAKNLIIGHAILSQDLGTKPGHLSPPTGH